MKPIVEHTPPLIFRQYICYVVYISVYVCANELSLDQRGNEYAV